MKRGCPVAVLAALCVFVSCGAKGASFSDASWTSINGLPGTSGLVRALAADTNAGALYVGGQFYAAGNVVASNIAVWNGTNYLPLGLGLNDVVVALAVDNGGALYAGGAFTTAGGVSANRIAKWSGGAWSALGPGMNGNVFALAVDGFGGVYAGGAFTDAGGTNVNYVAKWNGSTWQPLGSGMSGNVWALAVDGAGILYAGGTFSTAGGVPAKFVAQWDGTAWSPVGTAISNTVYALLTDSAGNLFAGFYAAGGPKGIITNGIAMWNGSAWVGLTTARLGGSSIYSLAMDEAGSLYVGGNFESIAGMSTAGVAKWDGSTWSALGPGIGGSGSTVYALSSYKQSLYVGGTFAYSYAPGNYLAKWDGAAWSSVPTIPGSVVGTLESVATDGQGGAYVAGDSSPARWDGTKWISLGQMTANSAVPHVYALAVDNAGSLYAGGIFSSMGTAPVVDIAKWNGTNWSALGTNGGPRLADMVYSIACDGAGNVYTAGYGLYCFTNGVWTNLSAQEVNVGTYTTIACNQAGELFAGGTFDIGNVRGNYVAKWTGTGWMQLGAFDGSVICLAFDKLGNLYVGGSFSLVGNVAASCIAKWDGTTWSALSSATAGSVRGIAFDPYGSLYAIGSLTSIGGQSVKNIARWDGNSWSKLGSGLNKAGRGIMCDTQGHLYVGGSFTIAGTNYSASVAVANLPQQLGLMTIAKSPPDSVVMSLQGNPGSTCFLESSTNFANWTTVSSEICNSNGLWYFTNATAQPKTFFRGALQ